MQQPIKKDQAAIQYLSQNVYPTLHTALMQLIDHVVKTEEVRKHQERLKKIKIFDKIEQKKVEKERLKAELGSAYESSEGSMDLEDMGINQSELDKYMGKEPRDRDRDDDDGKIQQSSEDQINSQEIKKEVAGLSLGEIREDLEDEDQNDKFELERMKQQLRQQREEMGYNPLLHLAQLIREQHQN